MHERGVNGFGIICELCIVLGINTFASGEPSGSTYCPSCLGTPGGSDSCHGAATVDLEVSLSPLAMGSHFVHRALGSKASL